MKRKAGEDETAAPMPKAKVQRPLQEPTLPLNKSWWFVTHDEEKYDPSYIIREWDPKTAKDPVATARAILEAHAVSKEKHKSHFARVMRWLDGDDEDEEDLMMPISFAHIKRSDAGLFERIADSEDPGCILHDGPTLFFTNSHDE